MTHLHVSLNVESPKQGSLQPLALWLGAAGVQTTLIERAPAPSVGGYVIDFWGLG